MKVCRSTAMGLAYRVAYGKLADLRQVIDEKAVEPAYRKLSFDNYTFYIFKKNYDNPECDDIGYYVDSLGYMHRIRRESLYGEHVKRLW